MPVARFGSRDGPWNQTKPAEADREYSVFTAGFFLKSLPRALSFVRRSSRVVKQLGSAPGIVGYSLAADLLRLRFYSLSASEDDRALRAFVQGSE